MSDQPILLVEDNPSDADLTIRAFERSNIQHQLALASDGQQALDYLRDAAVLPPLVLLDLKLPRVSGLDVLRQIRITPRTTRVPVIILTSSRQERDIRSAYDLGANSYIVKPVNFLQFTDTIRNIYHYWLVLNERPPHGPEPVMEYR